MKMTKIPKPLIALGICLVVGAIGMYLVASWANRPIEQTIDSTPPADVTPGTTFKTVRTSQFTTKVQENFREQTTENPKQPGLVQTLLHDTKDTGEQIGITVNHLPADGLHGVADYNLRAATPATYKPYTNPDLPADSQAFQKIDDSELSLFMTYKGRYASITASNHDLSTLISLLKTIVDNWQWL